MTAPPAGRLATPALNYLKAHKDVVVPQTAAMMHAFDKAHAVMLTQTAIVPPAIGRALLQALTELEAQGDIARIRAACGGGNHAGERLLSQRLGQAKGGFLGLARSSGDLSAVSIRLYLRSAIERIADSVRTARGALLRFAHAHVDTVMVGATHGQHAQPTTLAHWALMFEAGLARDEARLEGLYTRVNRCPAGSGIMTGSEFPIDRDLVARLLGFDGVQENTWDAVLNHDLEAEFAGVYLVLAQTLARLADDLILWSTYEYSWIGLPDWFCGTSSLMPQKHNPDGLEDFKSLTAQALGLVVIIAATERGATGLPIIERRSSDQALRALAEAMAPRFDVLPALLDALNVNRERMRRSAGANWAQTSDLAAALVRSDSLDWRTAHQLVGGYIRHCLDRHIGPELAKPDDFRTYAQAHGVEIQGLTPADFDSAMDSEQCVSRRQTLGGPAPAMVRDSMARAALQLQAAEERAAERRRARDDAASALHQAVTAIVQA